MIYFAFLILSKSKCGTHERLGFGRNGTFNVLKTVNHTVTHVLAGEK